MYICGNFQSTRKKVLWNKIKIAKVAKKKLRFCLKLIFFLYFKKSGIGIGVFVNFCSVQTHNVCEKRKINFHQKKFGQIDSLVISLLVNFCCRKIIFRSLLPYMHMPCLANAKNFVNPIFLVKI